MCYTSQFTSLSKGSDSEFQNVKKKLIKQPLIFGLEINDGEPATYLTHRLLIGEKGQQLQTKCALYKWHSLNESNIVFWPLLYFSCDICSRLPPEVLSTDQPKQK